MSAETPSSTTQSCARSSTRCVTIVLFSILALSTAASAQPNAESLRALQELYSSLHSVHLRAAVEVSIRLPLYDGHRTPVHGFGYYEHWEEAGKFRTRAWVDPRLGLVQNLEIAFDGTHYQVHMLDVSTLAVEVPQFLMAELQAVPTAVPNPFYLLTAFLAPSDDACPGCQPTLKYLRSETTWTEKLAPMGEPTAQRSRVYGGTRGNKAYSFRLLSQASPSLVPGTPARIDRLDQLDEQGQLVESIRFSDFAAVKGGLGTHGFPRRITLFGIDPSLPVDEHVVLIFDYTVEFIGLNGDLDSELFTLSRDEVSSYWVEGELQTTQ